jgi:hypothetical protein
MISIFPQKPGTETNWVRTLTCDVRGARELADIALREQYSTSVYVNNYAKNENFLSASIIGLDYDNKPGEAQLTLEQAKVIFSPYKCVIVTTRNHQRPKVTGAGKEHPAADRFRVLLFTSEPITKAEDFSATWELVSKLFPGVDSATKDCARRFFPGKELVLVNEVGVSVPVQRGVAPKSTLSALPPALGGKRKLSSKTLEFLAQQPSGKSWHERFIAAAFDLKKKGYDEEEAAAELAKASPQGALDSTDEDQLADVYNNRPLKVFPADEVDVAAVERWVREWLEVRGARISYKTGLLTLNGRSARMDVLVSRMVLDAVAYAGKQKSVDDNGRVRAVAPFSQQHIEHVLTLWVQEQRERVIDGFRQQVAFTAPNDVLERWMVAVTGSRTPMDLAVMAHFIWQVKRKLFDLEVTNHVMPVLYGKTNSGKTTAINQLLSPVDELTYATASLQILEDSRETPIFGKFYIVFFDEMERAEKVSVEALKNKVTSRTNSYRVLGTNQHVTEVNRATFLGASNKTVQDLIYDPTSARRFWQITTLDRLDWQTINNINYLEMWRGIDEKAASPITPYIDAVSRVQDTELRAKSLVELWLEERMDTSDHGHWMTASKAHELFASWCEGQGIKVSMTYNKLGRQLQECRIGRERLKNGVYYKLREKPCESADISQLFQS